MRCDCDSGLADGTGPVRRVPARGGRRILGVHSLDGLAAVAAAQGEYERAVRLFTAAARTRARLEGEMEPGWQDQIAPFRARAAAGFRLGSVKQSAAPRKAARRPPLGPLEVSHRTVVAPHLNRIKLGIRCRSEIAAWISGQCTAQA